MVKKTIKERLERMSNRCSNNAALGERTILKASRMLNISNEKLQETIENREGIVSELCQGLLHIREENAKKNYIEHGRFNNRSCYKKAEKNIVYSKNLSGINNFFSDYTVISGRY